MKPESFLSLKDYFNYYISGLVWCMAFIFWGLVFTGKDLYTFSRTLLKLQAEAGGLLAMGILGIFAPYILGYIFLPVGEGIRKCWQGGKERNRFPDPRKYLLQYKQNSHADPSEDEKRSLKFKGKRFSKKETSKITELGEKVFGIQYTKTAHLYFYPMRAYVMEHGVGAAALAERARDLANFAEGLLLPAPLALYGLVCLLLPRWFGAGIGLVLAVICHGVLLRRYFALETYWVKHVYTAFLVLASKQDEAR